jgi:hypothetical protein
MRMYVYRYINVCLIKYFYQHEGVPKTCAWQRSSRVFKNDLTLKFGSH